MVVRWQVHRQVSGVLFSMIVRWQVSGMCQECCSQDGRCQAVRSVVLYDSEMAGVRHVSGVLFSMIVRWQVSGMCQKCCSL